MADHSAAAMAGTDAMLEAGIDLEAVEWVRGLIRREQETLLGFVFCLSDVMVLPHPEPTRTSFAAVSGDLWLSLATGDLDGQFVLLRHPGSKVGYRQRIETHSVSGVVHHFTLAADLPLIPEPGDAFIVC